MTTEYIQTLTDPRESKRYFFHETKTRKTIKFTAEILSKLVFTLNASGIEHLPSSGGVVLASNHLTNIDVFAMQFVLPRPIFFMGKEELFRNPLLDPLLRRMGSFPVYRGGGDIWALMHSRRVLENEQVLGIFPEGRRSKGGGLQNAKTGAARLAIQSGCPIVPLGIAGTHEIFTNFPKRNAVTIRVGRPIYYQMGETVEQLTDRVMRAIAALLPVELHGVYTPLPA